MARFAVFVYGHDEFWAKKPEAEQRKAVDEYIKFAGRKDVHASGVLRSAKSAKTLRGAHGAEPRPSSGPFHDDARVAGWFVVDAENIEAATKLVRHLPAVAAGDGTCGLEIRELEGDPEELIR